MKKKLCKKGNVMTTPKVAKILVILRNTTIMGNSLLPPIPPPPNTRILAPTNVLKIAHNNVLSALFQQRHVTCQQNRLRIHRGADDIRWRRKGVCR